MSIGRPAQSEDPFWRGWAILMRCQRHAVRSLCAMLFAIILFLSNFAESAAEDNQIYRTGSIIDRESTHYGCIKKDEAIIIALISYGYFDNILSEIGSGAENMLEKVAASGYCMNYQGKPFISRVILENENKSIETSYTVVEMVSALGEVYYWIILNEVMGDRIPDADVIRIKKSTNMKEYFSKFR